MSKLLVRSILFVAFFCQGIEFSLAETLDQLRDQFKAAENQIVEKYDQMARQPGANKAELKASMQRELVANRNKFSGIAGEDPRFSAAEVQKAFESGKIQSIPEAKTGPGYIDELNTKLGEKGLKLKSTGGSADLTPSHINADVDAVVTRADGTPATPAEQMEGIRIVKEHGVAPGEVVHENAARFDNLGKDTTIWKPDSPEAQAAKLTDHDAFKTEGGRNVTRNPGAVADAQGEYLDNRAKFEAARVEGDLKTQAKSLTKAGSGEAAGVKKLVVGTDGKETFVRESDFINRNPELYDKAKKLKGYQTTTEADVTGIGDLEPVKKSKTSAFQAEMQQEMEALQVEAERKGALRDSVRENFQESYQKAADPNIAEISEEIASERSRVAESNRGASKAIAEDAVKPTAEDTYTGGRRGPGDPVAESTSAASEARINPQEQTGTTTPTEAEMTRTAKGTTEPVRTSTSTTGEAVNKQPSLLEGGKSSFQPTETTVGKVRSNLQAAETAMGNLAEADIARVNKVGSKVGVTVGELPASAGGARQLANVAAETGVAVAGAAYIGASTGHGVGSALVNLRDAYNEDDPEMKEFLTQRAKDHAVDTATHAATTTVAVGGAIASPVIVGGTLTGVGAYQGTRAILENTETGRAYEKSVQDRMTDDMTTLDDATRFLTGQKSYDEIDQDTLTARQSAWLAALRRGDIELQEGATVQDMLDYVKMQQADAKVSSLANLGDMKNVVRSVDPTQTRFVDDGLLGPAEEVVEGSERMTLVRKKRFVDDGLLGPAETVVEGSERLTQGPQKRFVDDGLLGDRDELAGQDADILYEPQKRFVDDGLLGPADEVADPLANAMVTNQPAAADRALWQNQPGNQQADPAAVLARTFSGTNAAGESAADQVAGARSTLTTTNVNAQDIEEEQRRKDAQLSQADERKRRQQGLDASKFSDDWGSTITGINVALNDLNKQDAIKVQQLTEAAIKMIQQMQTGIPNDVEFTSRMNQLEREAARLTAQGQQGWTNIRNQLMGNPGGGIANGPTGASADPCARDFTMNANMEMGCKCPGYSFDMSSAMCVGGGGTGGGDPVASILSSVPPDQIDTRTVTCNSASKSGGDSPASITVDVGNSIGTAQVSYDLEWVKDRLLVQYGGATIYDTGCARGSAVIPVALNGSGNQIHVVVQPACESSGTSWSFSVSCP